MFGHRFWGARYFGPRYFGSADATLAGFASDTLGAGAGHKKRKWREPQEFYLPPSRSEEERRKEREERQRRLRLIAARQERIARAEASRELLSILHRKNWPFPRRMDAAIKLYIGDYELPPDTQERIRLAATITDTLPADELSRYERPVSRNVIAGEIAELWMEDPERFAKLWPHMEMQ